MTHAPTSTTTSSPGWRQTVSPDVAPRIAPTLDELVADATDRVEVRPADAKSGAYFETLRINGVPHFLKVTPPPTTGSCE
jgi:hypothetical protein